MLCFVKVYFLITYVFELGKIVRFVFFRKTIQKLVQGVFAPIIPKVMHGVNEVWDHVRDGVNDVMDCITLNRPPTMEDVQYYLFTSYVIFSFFISCLTLRFRQNKDLPEEIRDLNFNKSRFFNEKFYTKMLIHGYTQSYKNEFLTKIKDGKCIFRIDDLAKEQIYNFIFTFWNFIVRFIG